MPLVLGRGMTPERIAASRIINSKPHNVRRYIARMDVPLDEGIRTLRLNLGPEGLDKLTAAAAARGMTVEALVSKLVSILADDPGIIAAILGEAWEV